MNKSERTSGERTYVIALGTFAMITVVTVLLWPVLFVRLGCSTASDCDLPHAIVFWTPWFAVLIGTVATAWTMRVHPTRTRSRILAGLTVVWWMFVGYPIIYGDAHTIATTAVGLPSAVVATVVWWIGRRRVRAGAAVTP